MKYKGVTLFSAALILLGSVGTATSYIVDNPTHVSAAEETPSIGKLVNSLGSLLKTDKVAKSEAASENDSYSYTSNVGLYYNDSIFPDVFKDNATINVDSDGAKATIQLDTLGSAALVNIVIDGKTWPVIDNNGIKEIIIPVDNDGAMTDATVNLQKPAPKPQFAMQIKVENPQKNPSSEGSDESSTEDQIKDVQSQITNLQNQKKSNDLIVEKMKNALSDQEKKLSDLEAIEDPDSDDSKNIETLKATIKGMEAAIASQTSKSNDFQSKIDSLKDKLQELQQKQLSDSNTQLNGIQDDLDSLNTEKGSLDTQSDALASTIYDLKDKLAELKKVSDDSTAAQKVIDNMTDKINDLETAKSDIDSIISQLKTKIDKIKSDLQAVRDAKEAATEAQINKIKSAITAAQTLKDTVKTKVTDLTSKLKTLGTAIQEAIAEKNSKTPVKVTDTTADEYQVPYVVNKTGTNTASASEQYFTQTAFVNPNDDGTFSVEVQMDYPLSYGEDAVKIDSVNGNDIDQSTVTTTSDDNSYLKSFKFNIDNLSDLNNAIPVTMDISIAGGIFSGTETADLVFDTTDLPIQDPTNNGNKQVLDNGSTGSGTAATSGTTLGTTGTTGTTGNTSGSLPQTDAKGLPTYIMYAGFIMLAVTLAGAGKVKFTGKK